MQCLEFKLHSRTRVRGGWDADLLTCFLIRWLRSPGQELQSRHQGSKDRLVICENIGGRRGKLGPGIRKSENGPCRRKTYSEIDVGALGYKDGWESLFMILFFTQLDQFYNSSSSPGQFSLQSISLRYSNESQTQQSRCIPLLSSFPSLLLLRLLFPSLVDTTPLSVRGNTEIQSHGSFFADNSSLGYKYSGGGCTEQTVINADPIFGTGNVCQPLNRNEGSPSVVSYKLYSAASGCTGQS